MTNTPTADSARSRSQLRSLIITALFIALTYVFTALVNVRLPIAANGGLIHLGNVPLFIGALLFGKKTGALAGGLGMALFDLLSGWTAWAPFTLVIVGLMGFLVGLIVEKKVTLPRVLLAFLAACAVKVAGYYMAEGILYGNWIAPASSIPGNLIQVGLAAGITLILLAPLQKAARAMKII